MSYKMQIKDLLIMKILYNNYQNN